MQTLKFGMGDRVEVADTIDLMPHTVLVPGEKGIIRELVSDMGIEGVEVELELKHPGLREWDNKALLTWPEFGKLKLAKAKQLVQMAMVIFSGTMLKLSPAMLLGAHMDWNHDGIIDTVIRSLT